MEKMKLLDQSMKDLLNCYCTSSNSVHKEPFKQVGITANIDKALKEIYGVYKRTSISVVCKKPFVYNSTFFYITVDGKKATVMKRFNEMVKIVKTEERIIVR